MSARPRAVLVTGASGFIGRQVTAALAARGLSVHAVTHRSEAPGASGVTWHRADLLEAPARETLIARVAPTHLVHLAWYVEHGKFWTAPENDNWAEASLDLVRIFANGGGTRALLTGTCAEYEWPKVGTEPLRETAPCLPATPYGRAKLGLFQAAGEMAESMGISFAWARFFFMFGPHEDNRRFIPTIARGLLANRKIPLSSGQQIRDFLDVRDIADAIARLLLADSVTGAVNVASGRALALKDVARMLARLSGRDEGLLDFGAVPGGESEPPAIVADISRLSGEVGYSPARTLEERLAETLAWHRAALDA